MPDEHATTPPAAPSDAAPDPLPEGLAAPAPPPPPLVPTSAREWRRIAKGLWLLRLPSGIVVKARRPDWPSLAARSVVPMEQLLKVQQYLGTPALYDECIPVARAVLPYIVVEPKMVNGDSTDLPDDLMATNDVQPSDALMLLVWATGWIKPGAIQEQEVTE